MPAMLASSGRSTAVSSLTGRADTKWSQSTRRPPPSRVQLDDALLQVDFAAPRGHAPGSLLPHLARAVLGIQESLDEAGLDFLLARVGRGTERLEQGVAERLGDRQALDALRAPL